jgi:hypothetical protein
VAGGQGLQEPHGGRHRLVAPQDKRVLESRGGPELVVEGGGDRLQPGELGLGQGSGVGPGAVEERELDH